MFQARRRCGTALGNARPVPVILITAGVALCLNLDLVHPYVLGYDLETIVNLLASHAVFAQVSDARDRNPGHVFSTPGEGEVDWPTYLKLLKQAGYEGYLMVHM